MSNQKEQDGKEHKFKNKIIAFFASEIASALFFLLIGLGLIAFPTQTMYFFTKIVFGLLLIFAGIYNIVEFLFGKKMLTVFHMFAGVVVLVLGLYLFIKPEVIIEVLPQLLGGLVIVDSIWMMQAAFRFYKVDDPGWKIFLPAGLVCFALGIIFAVNPFSEVHTTVLFGGIVFVLNGIADIVFYIIMSKDKKEIGAAATAAAAVAASEKKKEKEPKEHREGIKKLFKSKTEKETHFGDPEEKTASVPEEPAEFPASENPLPVQTAESEGVPEGSTGGQEAREE